MISDDNFILAIAMICITLLAGAVIIINRVDGVLLGSVIGALVFLATKKKYTGKVF